MSKFPEKTNLYIDELRRKYNAPDKVLDREILKKVSENLNESQVYEAIHLQNEINWKEKRRPFFNLHKSVLEGLSNTRLSIRPDQIPDSVVDEIGIIRVKLPVDLNIAMLKGIEGFFINVTSTILDLKSKSVINSKSVAFFYQTDSQLYNFPCKSSDSFDEAESSMDLDGEIEEERDRRRYVARIGLGVMLLASDPEFITPVLISKYRGKKLSGKELDDAVRKSTARGLIGFDIGKDVEVSPHWRRPHFAIRWTGKGGNKPRIVPVKGSIINKNSVADIPTGYEDDTNG